VFSSEYVHWRSLSNSATEGSLPAPYTALPQSQPPNYPTYTSTEAHFCIESPSNSMPLNTASSPNESTGLELVFLGTGTSSSTPHIDCLTADITSRPPCNACFSTLTPAGKKNIRRNTSAAVRMKARDGRSVYVISFDNLL